MEELKNELTSENAVEIMKELNELWKTYQDLKTGKEDVVSVLAVTAAKRIVTQNRQGGFTGMVKTSQRSS